MHPCRRRCSATRTCGTSSSTCTSPPTSSPASSWPAAYAVRPAARALGPLRAHGAGRAADDRRARRAGPGPRRRLGGARRRQGPADQARRDRGPAARRRRARRCTSSAGTTTARSATAMRDPQAALAAGLPRPQRAGAGARRRARGPTGRRSTSCASPSRRWSASARCWPRSARVVLVVRVRRRRLPEAAWFYAVARGRGPAVLRRAGGRLGDDRGRPPAVGRLRRDAHA